MNFTLIIEGLTDTKKETFKNCFVTLHKDSRRVEIENNSGAVVDYYLADSDRLEVRYHA